MLVWEPKKNHNTSLPLGPLLNTENFPLKNISNFFNYYGTGRNGLNNILRFIVFIVIMPELFNFEWVF